MGGVELQVRKTAPRACGDGSQNMSAMVANADYSCDWVR